VRLASVCAYISRTAANAYVSDSICAGEGGGSRGLEGGAARAVGEDGTDLMERAGIEGRVCAAVCLLKVQEKSPRSRLRARRPALRRTRAK
jgi:hypothetical protein